VSAIAYHKKTKVTWSLMTRRGIINTKRGDIDVYRGDVLITRNTDDQWPIDPETFMSSYDPDPGEYLNEAKEFWEKNSIPY